MRHPVRTMVGMAVALACVASLVYAANYSLWINGRNGGGAVGNHLDFTYWGPPEAAAGVNKRSVNWDGFNRISTQNFRIRDALDCYCTGTNWCYVAAHSAGDLQIGYALSLFGGTTREVKNAAPDGSGVCGSTGGTQTGWNIKWVGVAAGAAGGTELANLGSWAVADPLTADLKTSTARAMYDHNQTRAKWFYMYAGAKGALYSITLPGQDDEVVAYHSAGGVSGSGGASFCNPSDWFCNNLTLGSGPNEGGRAKWSYHSVSFRDDAEALDHYTRRNWSGVVSRLRADMESLAK
ncbi:hypothetical protein [Caenimonas soli]|uniref:hypothetical protein n=1 Tax=Caenimonas soli TaxID=2735555 RepID=UPI00155185DD|nr:hypothetical protein [Caenimonas soli]NPC55428.1 hypothetical protein [Caenimonas soli]